jgi:hypothetical protein
MTCPICITLYSSEPWGVWAKAKALMVRPGRRGKRGVKELVD